MKPIPSTAPGNDTKPDRWSVLDWIQWARSQRIGCPNAKRILIDLAAYAAGKGGYVHASAATICANLEISTDTFTRGLDKLRGFPWFKAARIEGRKGRPYEFWITPQDADKSPGITPQDAESITPQDASITPQDADSFINQKRTRNIEPESFFPPAVKSASTLPAAPEKKPPAQMILLPDDWRPDDGSIQFCREQGLDPAEQVERFRNHCADKGRKSKDWSAAFRNWAFNAKTMQPKDRASARDDWLDGKIDRWPLSRKPTHAEYTEHRQNRMSRIDAGFSAGETGNIIEGKA